MSRNDYEVAKQIEEAAGFKALLVYPRTETSGQARGCAHQHCAHRQGLLPARL